MAALELIQIFFYNLNSSYGKKKKLLHLDKLHIMDGSIALCLRRQLLKRFLYQGHLIFHFDFKWKEKQMDEI